MKSKIKQRIVQVLASVFLVAMVLLSVSDSAIPDALADTSTAKSEYIGLKQFKDKYENALKTSSEFRARYGGNGSNGVNTKSTELIVHNAELGKSEYTK